MFNIFWGVPKARLLTTLIYSFHPINSVNIVRYLILLLCGIALNSNSFAEPSAKNKIKSPVIAIGLSVANPCENSYYANMRICAGQVVQKVAEVSRAVQAFNINGEAVVGVAEELYTVRVIDFY